MEMLDDLWSYVEELWAKYDTDKDGHLVLDETALLYAELVMSHGHEIGLAEEHHM
jgi:hypothetical protein